jgi:hypothetical protein
LEGKNHLGGLAVNVRIILKWILKEIVSEDVDWINVDDDKVTGGLMWLMIRSLVD